MGAPDFAARPQLSDDVARLIRRRIFDGGYAAGSYIRLDQLAAELGISVTPVREALFALRAEGLIAQQPRRGFVVLAVTGRDVTDVANVQAHVGESWPRGQRSTSPMTSCASLRNPGPAGSGLCRS